MAVKRHRLAKRRRVYGFTQEALAEALGVDASTVRRWELGTTDPSSFVRPKLASALTTYVGWVGVGVLGV